MLVTVVGRGAVVAGGSAGSAKIMGEVEHLGDDLARSQVARQPAQGGGAEGAAHGAACLAGDAERAPLVVEHEHRFDGLAVGQGKEHLERVAVLGNHLCGQAQRRDGGDLGQLCAQFLGQVAHRRKVEHMAMVDPFPHLAGAVLGLAKLRQELFQFGAVELQQ
jgi:hypothetical protein